MQFLDPFEIDDRHDADQQVDVAGHVDALADISAVQALVEQQVAVGIIGCHSVKVPGSQPSSFDSAASCT